MLRKITSSVGNTPNTALSHHNQLKVGLGTEQAHSQHFGVDTSWPRLFHTTISEPNLTQTCSLVMKVSC